MTKEQIYEKISVITTGPNCIADMKVDSDKLASYLATIEERLEKVEGKTPKFIKRTDGLTEIEYYPTPTEVKDWEEGDYHKGYLAGKEDEKKRCIGIIQDEIGSTSKTPLNDIIKNLNNL